MTLELQLRLIVELCLAALLSALIGLDRERRDKSAGLRTHMLTGLGSYLFTALGAHFTGGDPTRIAAGVVSGIGFLGAGVIFRSENRVRDLTTAASIWVTAAVGASVAFDAWLLAIGATIVIWFVLSVIHAWEMRVFPDKTNDTEA